MRDRQPVPQNVERKHCCIRCQLAVAVKLVTKACCRLTDRRESEDQARSRRGPRKKPHTSELYKLARRFCSARCAKCCALGALDQGHPIADRGRVLRSCRGPVTASSASHMTVAGSLLADALQSVFIARDVTGSSERPRRLEPVFELRLARPNRCATDLAVQLVVALLGMNAPGEQMSQPIDVRLLLFNVDNFELLVKVIDIAT